MRTKKLRDRCHITGTHRSTANAICNLKTRQTFSDFLPVTVGNLNNYDAYLFLLNLLKKGMCKFDFIAKLDEKYASVTYVCIRFIDSFSFMNESLNLSVNFLKMTILF